MTMAWELLVAALVLAGGVFCFLGALGLARLPDVFMRLHGPSKASTLGIGCIALASMAYFSVREGTPSVHELLIIVFLVMTTPVSAHLVAKAALHRDLPRWNRGDAPR
ncbi:MAG: Na+/H+ antiporter subunit [Proteobacteria bacterium]|nr:Na+/H+ antiporter subunit [Pseudomonadota bacterium]